MKQEGESAWPDRWPIQQRRICVRRHGDSRRFGVFLVLTLLVGLASNALADDDLCVNCQPRVFEVVPGQPVRLELTLEVDAAVTTCWHVPKVSMLKLRAIEKLPVRKNQAGTIVYRRILVWQALQPGEFKLASLSVTAGEQELLFPEVIITVRDPGP